MLTLIILVACSGDGPNWFEGDAVGCERGLMLADITVDDFVLGQCSPVAIDHYAWVLDDEDINQLSAEAESRCYLIRYCELYEAECGPLDDPCDLIERQP